MGKPAIVLDKRFARAEVRCSQNGIVCYQSDEASGICLNDWIEYAVDTVRGRGRGVKGYALRDVRIIIEIGEVIQPH